MFSLLLLPTSAVSILVADALLRHPVASTLHRFCVCFSSLTTHYLSTLALVFNLNSTNTLCYTCVTHTCTHTHCVSLTFPRLLAAQIAFDANAQSYWIGYIGERGFKSGEGWRADFLTPTGIDPCLDPNSGASFSDPCCGVESWNLVAVPLPTEVRQDGCAGMPGRFYTKLDHGGTNFTM